MVYRFGRYELDGGRFELREDGVPIPAEPQVLSLLLFLAANRDRMVTKDEIIDAVWDGRIVSDAAVTSRIKSARSLIGDNGREQKLIRTVHGKGVRFLAELEEEGGAAMPPEQPILTELSSELSQRVEFCTAADGTSIAYSCVGDGPPLVKTANWLNHLEYEWESPIWRHWIAELTRANRLIRYDERGNGLSDRDNVDLSFDKLVNDLETVVDAAGVDRFDLLGVSQGCAVSIAYAVKYPERVRSLILYGGYPVGWAKRDEGERARREAMVSLTELGWGQDNPAFRQMFTTLYFPNATAEQACWFNELQRVSATPQEAVRLQRALSTIDVRHLLSEINVPTMVLHARGDAAVPFEGGRYLAQHIEGARFVALESDNHLLLADEPAWGRLVSHVRAFLDNPGG